MKKENTAQRLKEIMEEKHLKQIDIVRRCEPLCAKYGVKMNKSDISQYVAGKAEPSQDKLCVLGIALGVTESWLMGFDVAKYRKDSESEAEKDFDLFYRFSQLSEHDKKVVSDLIDCMLSNTEGGE